MKRALFVLAIVLILLLIGSEQYQRSQTLFFSPQELTLRAYSDTSSIDGEGGESTISLETITADAFSFSYTLSNSYAYYYAGVELFFKDADIDLSTFDNIKVTIDAPQSNTIRLFLLTDEPGITDRSDLASIRHLRKELPVKETKKEYTIPLAEFFTPVWWLDLHGVKESHLIRNPLTRVAGFKFESGEGEPIERPTSIKVARITLEKIPTTAFRLLQLSLLLLATTLLTVALILQKRSSAQSLYQPIELTNRGDEELEKVIDYIGTNFQNQDLKLDVIAEACSMHPDKVASVLKASSGQTFKQYLNAIRLDEAKRLLKETDRQISEVAYAVGYSSVSHFNRIFKAEFGETPTAFRTAK